MNKAWVFILILGLAIGIYFLGESKDRSQVDIVKTQDHLENSNKNSETKDQTGSGKSLTSSPSSPDSSPDQKSKGEAVLSEDAVQVVHQCAQKNSLSSLVLIKSGDKINDILKVVSNSRPLNRSTELENLHFVDEKGQDLRFQILSKTESRFFKVDNEGLPIRIDVPAAFKNLAPQEQKTALINAYKTPKFAQTYDLYESADGKVSIRVTQENDQIQNLQLFAKQSDQVGSLGCAIGESGSSILCKCL